MILLFLAGTTTYSQVIDKLPPSALAVTSVPADSLDSFVTFTDIIISGYKKTKPYIIQREVPFKKGDTIKSSELPGKLTVAKQQLINTRLFVDVDVKHINTSPRHVIVIVEVKERWYLFPLPYFKIVSRNFNTWWFEEKRSLRRVEYGVKFTQNNVTGRNDHLNFWFVGGFTQQFSVRYENPNIDKNLKHGINVGFGFRRNRELNYGMDSSNPNKIGFVKHEDRFIINQNYIDFTYTYRPALRTRHNVKVAYVNTGIDDVVRKLNPRYFKDSVLRAKYVELSYNLSYLNVDYAPYPLKGFSGEAGLHKRFGTSSSFWQLSARGSYSLPVSRRWFVHLQAAGLIRLPFHQPYISNTFMGSTEMYMRGLEYYVVEGVAGSIARATFKNELLTFNVRNIIKSRSHDKIPFRIYVKAYGDAGFSYTPNYGISRLNNKLLRTWGFGIDIVTFYDIVLRFEYSFNQLGDSAMFYHTQNEW